MRLLHRGRNAGRGRPNGGRIILRGRHDGRGHDLANATVIIWIVWIQGRKIEVKPIEGGEINAGGGLVSGLGVDGGGVTGLWGVAEDVGQEVAEGFLRRTADRGHDLVREAPVHIEFIYGS